MAFSSCNTQIYTSNKKTYFSPVMAGENRCFEDKSTDDDLGTGI